jgi:hypothetical protein
MGKNLTPIRFLKHDAKHEQNHARMRMRKITTIKTVSALTIASIGLASIVLALFAPIPVVRAAECPADYIRTDAGCFEKGVFDAMMDVLEPEMTANPVPALESLPVSEEVIYRRAFRRVMQATAVYDAPGGNVIGGLEPGFIFVNAGRGNNGWTQIAPGRFVPDEMLGRINTAVSKFSGVLLPDGMPRFQFAWVLEDVIPSAYPGQPHPETGTEYKRYQLVNIFATQVIDGWEWYLIGPNQWLLQTEVARPLHMPRPETVTTHKWFAVDLFEQTLIAYEGDKPVFATLISSGLPQWSTSEGTWSIFQRHEQIVMTGGSGADYYWLPFVPYPQFFHTTEQGLHGTYWHDRFGYRTSRGCVNMTITDSKWAYEWIDASPSETEANVYVYSSGDYRGGAPR